MHKHMAMAVGCLLMYAASAIAEAAALPLETVAMPAGQSSHLKTDTWLLHLPGIGGKRWVDDMLALGFRDAGYDGVLQFYDWTGEASGLEALRGYKRNQTEAQKVADCIAQRFHANPSIHIILTGHSGGTGIAVWALEKLPDDVKIDKLILLASALSPDYDLTKALSHVRGKCYSFCSENDVLVLGAGTKMFGTIDGKKTEAAGQFGFVFPKTGDAKQYEKLIQKPYEKVWMQEYHNLGDHLGCMLRPFAEKEIAPLFTGDNKPVNEVPGHHVGMTKADAKS